MVQMAKARPDKVKQVLDSVRQVGVVETYAKVQERLSSATPLGYSLSGTVVEVSGGLDDLAVGERVACAGEGIASHAEFVSVPRNLCASVPDGVDLKDAAFSTVGAIALNGVRQCGDFKPGEIIARENKRINATREVAKEGTIKWL